MPRPLVWRSTSTLRLIAAEWKQKDKHEQPGSRVASHGTVNTGDQRVRIGVGEDSAGDAGGSWLVTIDTLLKLDAEEVADFAQGAVFNCSRQFAPVVADVYRGEKRYGAF